MTEVIFIKNKFLICAIAAFIIIAAGTICMFSLTKSVLHSNETPDYIFDSGSKAVTESTASHSTVSSQSTVQTLTENVPDNIPEETADNTLRCSFDPMNYIDISLDGHNITVSGRYTDDAVSALSLSVYDTLYPVNQDSDGSFFGEIADCCVFGERVLLEIVLENSLTFRIPLNVTENGFTFANSAETQEKNTLLLQTKFTLPSEGVMEYISADNGDTKEILRQIQELSDKICEGITNDYDKLRAISQWVSSNIYYDFDASHNDVTTKTVALDTVISLHRSVCGGFANLFSALCQAQGITCYNIRGQALNGNRSFADEPVGSMHEWNVAEIHGRLITVDTVWNTSNTYIDKNYYQGQTYLRYFDISDELLSQNHLIEKCEYRDYFGMIE